MKIYPVKPYIPSEDRRQIRSDVEKILSSGMITTHTYTKEFEEKFAERHGTDHAVAVNSGSAALEMSLQMILGKGDKVLVPTNTFTATVAAVIRAGAVPVLADVDPETLNIILDPGVYDYIDAIMAVHIGGVICPNIKEIVDLCNDHELTLIEDAAHAHGSEFNGEKAGSFGDLGCFSLYATKIITSGEGGVVTTNNKQFADNLRALRDQGKSVSNPDEIQHMGFSYRFPEISAALGLTQLARLTEIIEARTVTAKFYDKEIQRIDGIRTQKIPEGMVTGYYKHVSFLDDHIDRDSIKQCLRDRGVICGGEVYPIPIHKQPVYGAMFTNGDFLNADYICDRMICLPTNAWMGDEEREFVMMNLKEVMEGVI